MRLQQVLNYLSLPDECLQQALNYLSLPDGVFTTGVKLPLITGSVVTSFPPNRGEGARFRPPSRRILLESMPDVGCPQTTILPCMGTINREFVTRVVEGNGSSRDGRVVGVGVAVVAVVAAVVAVAVVVAVVFIAAVVLGLLSERRRR